ncbi:hypothetical protein LLL96_005609, partial [Escherichia coli]
FIQDIPKINLKINLITLGFILRYSGHTYSGPRLHRRNRHQKKLILNQTCCFTSAYTVISDQHHNIIRI